MNNRTSQDRKILFWSSVAAIVILAVGWDAVSHAQSSEKSYAYRIFHRAG